MKNLSEYRTTVLIAKDKITGFQGKVTGHCGYITGCDQYLIQPDAKEGEWKESRWFDEGRLVVTHDNTGIEVGELQGELNGPDKPAPMK
jgi:hypothetical protein